MNSTLFTVDLHICCKDWLPLCLPVNCMCPVLVVIPSCPLMKTHVIQLDPYFHLGQPPGIYQIHFFKLRSVYYPRNNAGCGVVGRGVRLIPCRRRPPVACCCCWLVDLRDGFGTHVCSSVIMKDSSGKVDQPAGVT